MSCPKQELFCNLNSCTTVEGNRRQVINATLSGGRDVVAAYTHLNKFLCHCVGTAFRQSLVDSGSTRSAVGITGNEQLRIVVLSIVGQGANVYEILLRSNLGLVDVEEYRYRSGNIFLDALTGVLLVGQHVLQASVLCVGVVELLLQGIDLALRESLDSVNIGNLVPCSLAKVKVQTQLSIEHVVVRVPATGPVWICGTYNTLGKAACPSKQIPEPVLIDLTAEMAMDEITEIRAEDRNRLVFLFKNGEEAVKRWKLTT